MLGMILKITTGKIVFGCRIRDVNDDPGLDAKRKWTKREIQ